MLVLLLAFIGILIVKPVSADALAPDRHPALGYEDAVAKFAAIEQREVASAAFIPACRSKLLTAGTRTARVVVLFHGYTNCPAMFDRFGAQLLAAGFNVYIPLAPEHGEVDREHSTLADLTTAKLVRYGDDAVDLARGLGDSVTVLGLSGGGTVAAYLAQFRDDVDLAVLLAPFLGLRGLPASLTAGVINLADLLPSISWGNPTSSNSGSYAPYAGLDNNSRSAAAYMRLGHIVLAEATLNPHGARATVTVLNEHDDTVSNEVADHLTSAWRRLAPGQTTDYRFPESLGIPHDMIGPDRTDERTAVVYPVLVDLLGPP